MLKTLEHSRNTLLQYLSQYIAIYYNSGVKTESFAINYCNNILFVNIGRTSENIHQNEFLDVSQFYFSEYFLKCHEHQNIHLIISDLRLKKFEYN
jgi:hypothetical protein